MGKLFNLSIHRPIIFNSIEDCLGDDCGGGSGLPWPSPSPAEDPSDPNPWEPIIPGGSSDPCETCDPGENPDDDEQTCPLGQIDDGFGNCIDEEEDPCEGDNPPDYCSEPDLCIGDPLPNPEITPSNGWNVKGGMFGPTRNCDSNGLNCDLHDGIDISAELNSPLYSMHPGTVVEMRNPPMDP